MYAMRPTRLSISLLLLPACSGKSDTSSAAALAETTPTQHTLTTDSGTTSSGTSSGTTGGTTGGTSSTDSGDTHTVVPCETDLPFQLSPTQPSPGETVTISYTGALLDEDRVGLRYGFNGWNEVSGEYDWRYEEHQKDTDYWIDQATTDGVFTVQLSPEARALHLRFFSSDGKTWDDRDGLEYHHSLVTPYIGPLLTWDDTTAPHDGVVVSFETSLPCPARVEYGTTADLGDSQADTAAEHMHHIALTDLTAETTYFYRVVDGAGAASETWSFRTAPADVDDFSFGVLADMQDNGDGNRIWAEVAELFEAQNPDVDFLLLGGDMPANDEPGPWWTFFDKARSLFAGRVILPAVGNHDTPGGDHYSADTSSFDRYFALPDTGGVYEVRYGPALFLVLNSDVARTEFIESGAQYTWMETHLDATPEDVDWVFTSWHRPPYDVGVRFADEQEQIRPITGLFDGRVDWVLTGHQHIYQRMHPIRSDQAIAPSGLYGRDPGDGVGYIVMPSSGIEPKYSLLTPGSEHAWVRDLLAFPQIDEHTREVESELGWLLVTLSGESVSFESWAVGEPKNRKAPYLRDSLTYDRGSQ